MTMTRKVIKLDLDELCEEIAYHIYSKPKFHTHLDIGGGQGHKVIIKPEDAGPYLQACGANFMKIVDSLLREVECP